jgi:acetyl esterase/lipase
MAERGYVCVTGEYRVMDEAPWPAQIQDVKATIRWMRANNDSLGIDPAAIVVGGKSAGGHLALLAAGTKATTRLRATAGIPPSAATWRQSSAWRRSQTSRNGRDGRRW